MSSPWDIKVAAQTAVQSAHSVQLCKGFTHGARHDSDRCCVPAANISTPHFRCMKMRKLLYR
jgi:hypothetical protein